MKLKTILLAGIVFGLIIVPLVTASPSLGQNVTPSGDQTRDQQQLQTRDCTATVEEPIQTQDRLRTCDQQQLQTRDCISTNACNGDCNGTQLQTKTRLQESTFNQAAVGNANNEQNCYTYGYKHQIQQGKQEP